MYQNMLEVEQQSYNRAQYEANYYNMLQMTRQDYQQRANDQYKSPMDKFWGNVAGFWSPILDKSVALRNMDTYYNKMTNTQRQQTIENAASYKVLAPLAFAQQTNSGMTGFADFALNNPSQIDNAIGQMFTAAQENHAKRVQNLQSQGHGYWSSNLYGTGFTFLNMFGITQAAEGAMRYDMTNRVALSEGQGNLRFTEGGVIFGGWAYMGSQMLQKPASVLSMVDDVSVCDH